MANSVAMTTQEAIKALLRRGYSKRKIARKLGIHRNTVDHYAEEGAGPEGAKCTIPTPDSGGGGAPRPRASATAKPSKTSTSRSTRRSTAGASATYLRELRLPFACHHIIMEELIGQIYQLEARIVRLEGHMELMCA